MKKSLLFTALIASFSAAFIAPSFAQIKLDKTQLSVRESDLRASMQKIFTDHITWQRVVSVESLVGARDLKKAQDRLDRNVTDIGNAFKSFYGNDNGTKITDLFKQHVQLLAQYANAAKAGMDTKNTVEQMTTNADATATLLSSLNQQWKKDDLSKMLRQHVNDMKAEADLQIKDRGALDVKQMDASSDHGMAIADTFAYGIINQFPDKLK